MTALTILTANIGYGMAGMDRLMPSLRRQLYIHGWGALMHQPFPQLCGCIAELSALRRIAFVRKHGNLCPTLELIRRLRPDALVLNEVLYEIQRDEFDRRLTGLGFQAIAWSVSTHYPGTSLSTLVATKEPGVPISCTIPQRPSVGGGAAMAGIRLRDTSRSVFGVHLTFGSAALFRRQAQYVAEVAAKEKIRGYDVVIGGDWNECEAAVLAIPKFGPLDLISGASIENPTCPTFLPRFCQKPLDHVFIPRTWRRVGSQTIAFGSDHLSLAIEVEPPVPRLAGVRQSSCNNTEPALRGG